jgi:Ca2+-binding RTX toxin-like protein
MIGGSGDDSFYVDNKEDKILEAAEGGWDTVTASISWSLDNQQEIEGLKLNKATGTAALNLTGNKLNNILGGNAGANTLDGAAGADKMTGGLGDDRYIVDDRKDQVFEAVGGGNDTLVSSTSYILAAGQEIEQLELAAGTEALNLTGNAFKNILVGNAGANILDGGAGADTMKGAGGNDAYKVNDTNDKVVEAAGDGWDTITASLSWTLDDVQEIEGLQLDASTGTLGLNLTGNKADNILIGNAGANVLDGRGGADKMTGGLGNDRYIVDDRKDQVIEAAGGGTDTIISSVSYVLAAEQQVERVELAAGTQKLNLTGNGLVNTLVGNAGDNVLNGGAGADTMTGGAGNDSYYVDNLGDKVVETAGKGWDTVTTTLTWALGEDQQIEKLRLNPSTGTAALNLDGNHFGNQVIGNAGANLINGQGGGDQLTGGAGADTFVFDQEAIANAIKSRDTILDFSSAEGDKIDLSGIDANGEMPGFQHFSVADDGSGSIDFKFKDGQTLVQLDINDDGVFEYTLALQGTHHLGAGDFLF